MTMTMRINKDDKYDDNDEPLCGGSSLCESLQWWKLGGVSCSHLNIIVFVILFHCYHQLSLLSPVKKRKTQAKNG